jgi:hypothetical protein
VGHTIGLDGCGALTLRSAPCELAKHQAHTSLVGVHRHLRQTFGCSRFRCWVHRLDPPTACTFGAVSPRPAFEPYTPFARL